MDEIVTKAQLEQELRSIFLSALTSHWERISLLLRDYLETTGTFSPNWWALKELLANQYEQALSEAIKTQKPLFEEVAVQIARKEAEKKLRQKLQAKGMSTELLDSIAKED